MTDLPPDVREARHKVLYWMMGSNTDSTEAAERNGKLLDALVTALCAWQRAQDVAELRYPNLDLLAKANDLAVKVLEGREFSEVDQEYYADAGKVGLSVAADHLEALK